MSLLNIIRNHFSAESDDDSVDASRAAIEESKQARVQMNEQAKQAEQDALQTSIDQERIRANIMEETFLHERFREEAKNQ